MFPVVTCDYESDQIFSRPRYPPKPCGVAIKWPGKKGRYYAWGHPTENNCTYDDGLRALREVWASAYPILWQNGKFDMAIATEVMGLPMLPWHRLHDSMFLIFLADPSAKSFGLKQSAERLLNWPPEERDAVHDWLMEHKKELGIAAQETNMGKYIALAPGKLVGEYAIGDVDRTEALFNLLYPLVVEKGMLPAYDVERELMPILLANEQEGMRVNYDELTTDLVKFEDTLVRMDEWLCHRLKTPDMNLNSGPQLAEALARCGVVTEFARTAKGNISTAKGTLTLDLFSDPRVYRALTYRTKLAYSLSTFMRPWRATADATGGTIHTNWNQVAREGAGAVTGRMSSNPNFQNMTKFAKEEDSGYQHPHFLKWAPPLPFIRHYILPDDGQIVGVRDVSQEELRLTAHYEGGPLMAEYLADPKFDMHNMVQALLADAGKILDRYDTKRFNFGILYGMGAKGLAKRLNIPKPAAQDFIKAWHKIMPGVSSLIDAIKEEVRNGGVISTWGGRIYGMPPPMWDDGEQRDRDYVLLNYLIQGSGADILKRVIIDFHKEKRESRMMLTVHDELPFSAPAKAMRQEQEILRKIIARIPCDVPMQSEGKTGPNLGDLKEWQDTARKFSFMRSIK